MRPIYPVPVKPRTSINTWDGWPDDVRTTLRHWNGGHRGLSFRRSATGSIFEPTVSVFKCSDCEQFCEPHPHGAAVLKGDWLCDDCLIARARTRGLVPM
jgi:hypothetical protein